MTSTDLLNHDASTQATTDDFKRIKGIGPGIERRLHASGILTFTQLAALSVNEIAVLLADIAGLSAARITEQDWIGQAEELAAEQVTDMLHNDTATPVGQQHYATFTVELLLEEGNEVRRTRVVHIQSGAEQSWAGWEEGHLVDSIVQHAGIHLQPVEHLWQPTDLQLNVGEILLEEVSTDETIHEQVPAKRIRAQMNFQLLGSTAGQTTASQSRYYIQILACELKTGQTITLATDLQYLVPEQAGYNATIEFELPDVGHYQILGTVLLSNAIAGVTLGPVLTVIP